MSRKHPGPYRPKPGSAVTGVLQLIASACERGLTAADIAKTLDLCASNINPLLKHALSARVIQVRLRRGINADGRQRTLRHYLPTPALAPCLAELNLDHAAPPAPPNLNHPIIDAWLLASAATTPRIPLPGFRVVSDFLNTGRLAA